MEISKIFFSAEKGIGYFSDAVKIVSPTDGRSAFVIEVDQQEIAPRLADDLSAVQSVDVVGSVHDLVGADAIGVIHELQERLAAVAAHLLELAAVPSLPMPASKALRGYRLWSLYWNQVLPISLLLLQHAISQFLESFFGIISLAGMIITRKAFKNRPQFFSFKITQSNNRMQANKVIF